MRIAAVLLVLMLAACAAPRAEGDPGPYADLKGFFEGEAERLRAEGFRLLKVVGTGEGRDSVVVAQPDWAQELILFQRYDLGHPAMSGRYRVDSSKAGLVRYRAVDPDLPLRRALVHLDGANTYALLEDSVKNSMYANRRTLTWNGPQGLYRIGNARESRLFKGEELWIEGRILPPE